MWYDDGAGDRLSQNLRPELLREHVFYFALNDMVTPSWVRFFGLQYTWGSEEGNWNAFRHKPFPEIALLPNLFPWSVQLNNFHDDCFKAFRHVVCVFEPWKCMPEIRRRHWYVPPPARWRQWKPNWALLNDDWVNLSSRGDRLNPRLKTAAVNCIRYTWSCATLDKCEIKSWTMHQENVWPFAVVHTSCRKPAVTTNPMSGNPVVVTLYMLHVNWIGPMVENMSPNPNIKLRMSHKANLICCFEWSTRYIIADMNTRKGTTPLQDAGRQIVFGVPWQGLSWMSPTHTTRRYDETVKLISAMT